MGMTSQNCLHCLHAFSCRSGHTVCLCNVHDASTMRYWLHAHDANGYRSSFRHTHLLLLVLIADEA